jgi:hypothetical protein
MPLQRGVPIIDSALRTEDSGFTSPQMGIRCKDLMDCSALISSTYLNESFNYRKLNLIN